MIKSLQNLKKWQKDSLALLFFIILTIFMTWPVLPQAAYSLEQWGDALLQTWTLDWVAHALWSDPLHFADANAFYPYNNSLAFSETLIGQAVIVAPLIWLTDNPILAYNVLLLASFVLCGWGMYLLATDLTGSHLAGVIAGLIFAFFPHRFGQLSHLHLLTAQWMPFCLLFLSRFLQTAQWRNVGLFGFFLVLQLLSSTYLGLFLVATVGLYVIYRLVGLWRNGQPFLQKVLRLAVVTIIAVMVVLPFYWPYLAVQQNLGFERSASEVQSFSAQPFYYLDVPKENKFNQWLYKPLFEQNWWQSSAGGERGLYLGIIALFLTVIGSLSVIRRRQWDGIFYIGLAALAVSFTFGPYWQTGRFGVIPLPYALLYHYVPGYGAIRVPVRFIYVVALAISILAAYGTLSLFRLAKYRRTGLITLGLLILVLGEYRSDVSLQASDVLRRPAPAIEVWLDAHPQPALHVPLSGSDNSNLFLQYWTRGSWRKVMNGFSGFMPPAYDALKLAVSQEGFSSRIIELLQGLEVRYLVIETADPLVKPSWPKLKADLAKKAVTLAAEFGTTLVYELPDDDWLRKLDFKPSDKIYFAEYRRDKPALLEFAASYLQSQNHINSFGSILLGFRPLPVLPNGEQADWLVLQAGEDPSLYGFSSEGQVFTNDFLAVYKKDPNLLARYTFSEQPPLTFKEAGGKLVFGKQATSINNSGSHFVRLGIAALENQSLEITALSIQKVELLAGFSIFELALSGQVTLQSGNYRIVWIELRKGTVINKEPILRPDVALLSLQSKFEASNTVASTMLRLIAPAGDYSATFDVYNTPWGSHPSGHYGYWSIPLVGGKQTTVNWQLALTRKTMLTTLNQAVVPNYPPNPTDFDITKYGNFGDFKATINLYKGANLFGSHPMFEFSVWAEGDKNKLENRRAGAFEAFDSDLIFLVLPIAK